MPATLETPERGAPAPSHRALTSAQLRSTGGVRFPLVDSLRAIAALFVVIYHFAAEAGPPHAVAIFTSRLNLGVTLFFLISGFLLYRPFVAARFIPGRKALATGRYAWHRFVRIVPAYWVALTVTALWLGYHQVFGPDWIVYYGFGQVYSFRTILGGIGQGWTLSIELAFYVFLPFWAWAIARIPARTAKRRVQVELIALAGLFALSLIYKPVLDKATSIDPKIYFALVNALPRYLDQFAIGMALAVASVWFETHRKPNAVQALEERPWIPWLGAAIALLALAELGSQITEFGIRTTELGSLAVHYLQLLVAVGLFLPAVFGSPRRGYVRKFLGARALIWVGVVSYGLYLWHVAVIVQISRWHIPQDLGISTGLGGLLVWGLFSIVPSLALAAASWYLIERSSMRYRSIAPPAWLKRLISSGRPGWANPARVGAFALGAIVAWIVVSNAVNPPGVSGAPVQRRIALAPTGSGRGWTYVAATYDSNALRMYENGRQIATAAATGPPGPSSDPIDIGNFVGTAKWTGPIQYAAVYRSALTPAQIESHYNTGLSGWSRFETALNTAPAPAYLWRDGLPASSSYPAHPPATPNFTLEAWLKAGNITNRVVLYQLNAWFLQTDLLGHWRAGVFVNHSETDATSTVSPPRRR
jgi:peptidoglycan/LPS O-acetylase OafA/YrhL